jgi:hypothetical protein
MTTKLKCIKGLADDEMVMLMKGDIVEVVKEQEKTTIISIICGFSLGFEFEFTHKELIEHFEFYSIEK